MLAALCALAVLPRQGGFRFALYGDCRDGHDMHRKVVAGVMDHKPAFVIQTGDLVARGSNESLWKIYDDIIGELRKSMPVYPARGNHDLGGPGYEERVSAPFTSGNKLYYSFDKGNVHFVSLDLDEHSDYSPSSDQYRWMVSDLGKADESAQHIVVFFHVPPYSIGSHGSDLDVRKTLCPVFEKFGVDAVLNGHDHNYYRTMRNGVTYIVSGGGGAPLYPCDPAKGANEGDKYKSAYHFIIFDVKGADMKGQVIGVDGSLIDSFTIHSRRDASRQ